MIRWRECIVKQEGWQTHSGEPSCSDCAATSSSILAGNRFSICKTGIAILKFYSLAMTRVSDAAFTDDGGELLFGGRRPGSSTRTEVRRVCASRVSPHCEHSKTPSKLARPFRRASQGLPPMAQGILLPSTNSCSPDVHILLECKAPPLRATHPVAFLHYSTPMYKRVERYCSWQSGLCHDWHNLLRLLSRYICEPLQLTAPELAHVCEKQSEQDLHSEDG